MPGRRKRKRTLDETLKGSSLMGVDAVAPTRRKISYGDPNALKSSVLRRKIQVQRVRDNEPSWTRHKFYKDNPQFLGAAKKRGTPIWKMKKPVRPGRAFVRWADPKYKGRTGPEGWKTKEREFYAKWAKEEKRSKRQGK